MSWPVKTVLNSSTANSEDKIIQISLVLMCRILVLGCGSTLTCQNAFKFRRGFAVPAQLPLILTYKSKIGIYLTYFNLQSIYTIEGFIIFFYIMSFYFETTPGL